MYLALCAYDRDLSCNLVIVGCLHQAAGKALYASDQHQPVRIINGIDKPLWVRATSYKRCSGDTLGVCLNGLHQILCRSRFRSRCLLPRTSPS
jgi:hypothetical protein